MSAKSRWGAQSSATARSRRRRRQRLVALATTALVAATLTVWAPASGSWAADYPTWDDVKQVRADEAAAKRLIQKIEGLIVGLNKEVERTQAEAKAKGDIYYQADLAFQEAAYQADQLQQQADAAQARADESLQRAGQLAAQLARAGGSDLSASLFANPRAADQLLSTLGFASKLSEQAQSIYEKAVQDQNTAQSLTDQANVAKELREQLRAEAEIAFQEAQAAADAAQAALEAQRTQLAQLEAQLVVLKEKRAATERDYAAGVAARIAAGAGGTVSASGWAKPVSGWISSSWGYRAPPKGGASSFHQGVDIASACGNPIYAATEGVVEYAGWNGGYGNYIRIDHGGGRTTAYGHIRSGGLLVSHGEVVIPGQNIARVGTTGTSTGCHLHFEVRMNGISQDPVPFMRDRGITIG